MRRLVEEFLQRYVLERDVERTLEFVTEDVISVGTGEHEIAVGKHELRKLLELEFQEISQGLEFVIEDYQETKIQENIFVQLNIKIRLENRIEVFKPRLTCTCVRHEESWRFSCLHMSTPNYEQEATSFFPLHYGKIAHGEMPVEADEKLSELILKVLPGGIMGGYLDDGWSLYTINDKMLQILGYTSYEELAKATDEKMVNILHPEDRARVQAEIEQQFAENGEYLTEYRAVGKDNRVIWVSDIGKKITADDGREAMISIMTDITERVERENRLADEAERDPLTGLHNRRKLIELVEAEFAKDTKGTLFICDVDNFKSVNDTKGHTVGDTVLRKLARVMEAEAGEYAIIARLGGDEYALFFPETVCFEDAVQMLSLIQQKFYAYAQETLSDLKISLSVGGAVRNNAEDIRTLYRKADGALYEAKQNKGTLKML